MSRTTLSTGTKDGTMNPRHFFAIAFAAAALAGCEGEAGEPGPAGARGEPGSSCAVLTVDDSRILRCPDGDVALLPSCTVESNDESQTIRCGDGAPLVLRPGESAEPSGIRGTATRFGLDPGAGIEVELIGLDRKVSTDARGRFEFNDLPPGLYRLRLNAPGYTSLEVGDVIAAGRLADVGELVLKVGRKVASGLHDAVLSPGQTKLALIEALFNSGSMDLSILDLETWERTSVPMSNPEDFETFAFVDDRRLAYSTWEGGADRLHIYDLESGDTEEVEDVWSWSVLTGGILYNAYDRDIDEVAQEPLHFYRAGGLAPLLVGDGYSRLDYYLGAPGRFALIETRAWTSDPGFMLFDSEHPETPIVLASRSTWDAPVTGHIAFFRADETEGTILSILDAETGAVRDLGPASGSESIWWSPNGDHLATSLAGDYRVFSLSPFSEISFSTAAYYNLQLSPQGTMVHLSDGLGNRVHHLSTGSDWLVGSSNVAFSPDDRWVAALRIDRLELIDTTLSGPEGFTTIEGSFGYDLLFVGGFLLYTDGEELVRLEPQTLEEERFPIGAPGLLLIGESVAFTEEDGELAILHVVEATISLTGIRDLADVWVDEESGYLTVRAGIPETLYRIRADDGAVTPIDDGLLDFVLTGFEGGLLYMRSDLDMETLISSFAFETIELCLVLHP